MAIAYHQSPVSRHVVVCEDVTSTMILTEIQSGTGSEGKESHTLKANLELLYRKHGATIHTDTCLNKRDRDAASLAEHCHLSTWVRSETSSTYHQFKLVHVLGLAAAVLTLLGEQQADIEQKQPPVTALADNVSGVPHRERVLQQDLSKRH